MTEKKRQEIIIKHYDHIRGILMAYDKGKIGLQEAMYCMCGIIEIILKKL